MRVSRSFLILALAAALGLSACTAGSQTTLGDDDAGGAPADTRAPAPALSPSPAQNSPDGDAPQDEQQNGLPATPAAPLPVLVSDAPCAFPASLGYDAASDTLLMACGGMTNNLFRSAALPAGDTWTSVGEVAGYPSHHLMLDARSVLVNHSWSDGFTILDTQTATATDTLLFSDIDIVDAEGDALAFTPNNPNGAILVGGNICVATSNLDHADWDPALTTFFPGTILCFPYLDDGTVDHDGTIAYPTSGINPTGMVLLDPAPRGDGTQRFAVLSSGPYVPDAANHAALDICVAPAMSCTAVDLGAITAQISPLLAVAEGRIVLAGVQKPANKLLGIDVSSGAIVLDRAAPEIENFIASIAIAGHVIALSDFGIFGVGGAVLFANGDAAGWTGVPRAALTGSAGPSVVVGDTLYQAVTANDGANGSVWKMDTAALQ
jgi:hypothetical protein